MARAVEYDDVYGTPIDPYANDWFTNPGPPVYEPAAPRASVPAGVEEAAERSSSGYSGEGTGTGGATAGNPNGAKFTGDARADWIALVAGLPPTRESIAKVFPIFAQWYPGASFEKGDIRGPFNNGRWVDVIGNLDDPSQPAHWQWLKGTPRPAKPGGGGGGTGGAGGQGFLPGGAFPGGPTPWGPLPPGMKVDVSDAQSGGYQGFGPGLPGGYGLGPPGKGLGGVSLTELAAKGLAQSPGYQARLQAGQEALERSAAARGTLLTGGTLKGLNRFAQDMASNEYQNQYARLFGEHQQGFNEYMQNRAQGLNEYQGYHNVQLGYGNLGLGYDRLGLDTRQQGFNERYQTTALGQNAAQSAGNLGATYANLFGNLTESQATFLNNLITGRGNVTAAGQVGGTTAIQQAINAGLSIAQIYALQNMGLFRTT